MTNLLAHHAGALRGLALAVTLASGVWGAACQAVQSPSSTAASPDTWAVVDGKAITKDDIEKAYRRSRDASQTPSPEEELLAKMSLLDDRIVEELLVAQAGTLKIEVPQAELDTAESNAKKDIPADAYEQELKQRNLTAADMRDGLRRQLVVQKVIQQEVGDKVAVSDQEIADFFNANRAQFNLAEESYRLAQIVVTPVREAQAVNRTGNDASTAQEAGAKVQMLMQQLKAGAPFQELAANYSEDPESGPRGGDIGLVPLSQLKQAPPQLQAAVLGKPPGTVNVASAGGAHTLVLVVAHEAAGQRDLSTAGVKDGISQTLRARKEQLLRAAYLARLRNAARVEHHLARRLVDGKGVLAP
jgi:parvulin-like peptidyl-prolyl isomerase